MVSIFAVSIFGYKLCSFVSKHRPSPMASEGGFSLDFHVHPAEGTHLNLLTHWLSLFDPGMSLIKSFWLWGCNERFE